MAEIPILQKPRMGDACNRCGECCRTVQCPPGLAILGHNFGTCRALQQHDDGTTSCGLMVEPLRYATIETIMDNEAMVAMLLLNKNELDLAKVKAPGDVMRIFMEAGKGCDSVDRLGVDSDIPEGIGRDGLHDLYEKRSLEREANVGV